MPPIPFRIDSIDTYEGDGLVDWRRVAEQNVSIAIVKAHENGFRRDGQFHANWPAMRDAGLIRGAFQFFNARTPAATMVATRQLVWDACDEFIQIVRDAGGLEPGDLPLIFDMERNANQLAVGDLLDQVVWWLSRVRDVMRQDTGRPDILPMIYTGNFWRETLQNATTHTAPDGTSLNFGDFPLWLAGYPRDQVDANENCLAFNTANPDDAATLSSGSFSSTGAPRVPAAWWNSPWILWQHTHCARMEGVPPGPQLDASVTVSLSPRRNASGAVTGAAMQRTTDLRPLMELAGVAPPRQPRELTKVTGLSDRPPEETFNVLVIGQGFWPHEMDTVVNQMLHGAGLAQPGGGQAPVVGVMDVPPLNLLAQPAIGRRVACYYNAGGGNPDAAGNGTEGTFLRLRSTAVAAGLANELAPASSAVQVPQILPELSTLEQYIASLRVRRPDGSLLEASQVWRSHERRVGSTGNLVVVLRKPQTTWRAGAAGTAIPPADGELYQLDPSEDSPVPFVAVNVVPGGNWPLVVARAIAQNLAGLVDEFELEGTAFAKPPEGALQPDAPNLVYFDDARRAQLAGGAKAQTVLPELSARWNVPANAAIDFVPHDVDTPNNLPPWNGVDAAPGAAFHLVEGGDGYRRNTARCDRDCLMRRIPATVAAVMHPPPALPIQSNLRAFCKACQKAVREALAGTTRSHLATRVDIDDQRILFDWIPWTKVETLPLTTVSLQAPATLPGPRWGCTLDFSNHDFTLTGLQLANAAFWDPAGAAQVAHVLRTIAFTAQVTFADGSSQPLPLSAALSPATRPAPQLAPAPALLVAQQGDAAGEYQLGIKLSLAWKVHDRANRQCIVDGVLSLVLRGVADDADPAGLLMSCKLYPQLALRYRRLDRGLGVTGFQSNIMLTANNADPAQLDGTLKSIAQGKLAVSAFAESNVAGHDSHFSPEMVLYDGDPPYHRITTVAPGRKLATVRGPILKWAVRGLFPPPHWSWHYDYASPLITGSRTLLAVHAENETGFAVGRDRSKVWPLGQAGFQSSIHKLARQGAYDGLRIHPEQTDSLNQPLVGAPASADLALTLYWRRGLAVTGAPGAKHRFAGWGSGRLDQGANSRLGAPLCPPNQRVDVQVARAADGSTVAVTYGVKIGQPRLARWQVVLEQGLSFSLGYAMNARLRSPALAWLSTAVGADPDFNAVWLRISAKLGDPVGLDAEARSTMRKIFQAGRRFDATLDGSSADQVPAGASDPANLENL